MVIDTSDSLAIYGDCFAYALAHQLGEPPLCKGDDFARTDRNLVLPTAPRT